jgi:hypothetical protein
MRDNACERHRLTSRWSGRELSSALRTRISVRAAQLSC